MVRNVMGRYHGTCQTPIGELVIVASDEAIVAVQLSKAPYQGTYGAYRETPLIATTARQLQEFFLGKRRRFDIPLALQGTPFQQSVWRALQDIPYGETRSYRDIAIAIGNAKAVRAVGMANNRNPISFIIPCHRVIGADGSLVGYGGGLPLKAWLLAMERAVTRGEDFGSFPSGETESELPAGI